MTFDLDASPSIVSTVAVLAPSQIMRYGQIVMGPAGSGKVCCRDGSCCYTPFIPLHHTHTHQSTYCSTIVKHCQTIKRAVHVVNLDPAAEHFDYPVEVGMLKCSYTVSRLARQKAAIPKLHL